MKDRNNLLASVIEARDAKSFKKAVRIYLHRTTRSFTAFYLFIFSFSIKSTVMGYNPLLQIINLLLLQKRERKKVSVFCPCSL